MGDEKQSDDLMAPDVAIAWTGTAGKVSGTLYNVTEFTGFSGVVDEQSGHYFAFELDAQYEGEDVTVTGARRASARSRLWVVRVDELYEGTKTLTVEVGGRVIFTLDFTPATLAA